MTYKLLPANELLDFLTYLGNVQHQMYEYGVLKEESLPAEWLEVLPLDVPYASESRADSMQEAFERIKANQGFNHSQSEHYKRVFAHYYDDSTGKECYTADLIFEESYLLHLSPVERSALNMLRDEITAFSASYEHANVEESDLPSYYLIDTQVLYNKIGSALITLTLLLDPEKQTNSSLRVSIIKNFLEENNQRFQNIRHELINAKELGSSVIDSQTAGECINYIDALSVFMEELADETFESRMPVIDIQSPQYTLGYLLYNLKFIRETLGQDMPASCQSLYDNIKALTHSLDHESAITAIIKDEQLTINLNSDLVAAAN